MWTIAIMHDLHNLHILHILHNLPILHSNFTAMLKLTIHFIFIENTMYKHKSILIINTEFTVNMKSSHYTLSITT